MFDSVAENNLLFRQDEDRFDVVVQNALADRSIARRSKDKLCDTVRSGGYDRYAPHTIPTFGMLDRAASQTAMLNVVDFLFEPIVLSSMQLDQLTRYFTGIDRSMSLQGTTKPSYGRGALIETAHHSAIFSIIVNMAQELARNGGKSRMILLHQATRPDPRLDLATTVMRTKFGVQLLRIPFSPHWMKTLASMMTPTTTVVYLADMPPAKDAVRRSRSAFLRLNAHGAAPLDGVVQTLSVASKICKILDLVHLRLDFPDSSTYRIAPASQDPLECPLDDWVFWPALQNS